MSNDRIQTIVLCISIIAILLLGGMMTINHDPLSYDNDDMVYFYEQETQEVQNEEIIPSYSETMNSVLTPNIKVESPTTPTVPDDEWTIMVYMDADNNLESAGIEDLNELESIDLSETGINIIVLLDRANGYDTSNGDWTGSRLFKVAYDTNMNTIGSVQLQDWGEVNMGDGGVLEDFLYYGLSNYPANKTALVIWDHGGAIDGIAWDDASNHDQLTVSELALSIRRAKQRLSTDGYNDALSIIGMDACLMASLEVAYEIRDLADYMVASEELEPGDGWPYELIAGDLKNSPSMTAQQLARVIVDRFVESYRGLTTGVTQSAIKLNKIAEFSDKLSEFASTAKTVMESEPINSDYNDTRALERARDSSLTFSNKFVDIYHFLDIAKNMITDTNLLSKAEAVLNNWNTLVVAENHDSARADSHGLTVFFPKGSSSYSQNLAFKDLNWDSFLSSYYTSIQDSAYQSWKVSATQTPMIGVDVGIYWVQDNVPAVGELLNVSWTVYNNGTVEAKDLVLYFYETGINSKEDPILVGTIEINSIAIAASGTFTSSWTMTEGGYRSITLYLWSIEDNYQGNNIDTQYVWVLPTTASVSGYIYANITDEGYPYMYQANKLYFEIWNWGSGAVPTDEGDVQIWAYSYSLDTYYSLANYTFTIEGWTTGYPPVITAYYDWTPDWGGYWDIIMITSYENDPYKADDVDYYTVWVIDADCDLEINVYDYDTPIQNYETNFQVLIMNFGLTAPGSDAAVLLYGYNIYEGQNNDTYDWEFLDGYYLTGVGGYEDINWYTTMQLSWTPDKAGEWILYFWVVENITSPNSDNDYIPFNDEFYFSTWAYSYNPDIQVYASTIYDFTYQEGKDSWIYIEIWNFGVSDSTAGDTIVEFWDYDVASETWTLIFSGSTAVDIPGFSGLYDWLEWTPATAGEHILYLYAEDVPYEPYSVIDELNFMFLYVTVEEAPDASAGTGTSIFELDDFEVSLYSTAVGDVDNDGVIEIVVVGNVTDLSSGYEFFGLWIFTYDASYDALVLEYETYWSEGSEESLSSVIIADLDDDSYYEILIAGFYFNETDSHYYSWVAITQYVILADGTGYLDILTYNTIKDAWIQEIDVGQLDTFSDLEITIAGYFWYWDGAEYVLYGFFGVYYYSSGIQSLVEMYTTYWEQGDDFYLESIALADIDYPSPDNIDEIVMVGYYWNYLETTWYSYTAVYTLNTTNFEYDLLLIDYEAVANTYIMSMMVGNVDQYAGQEIVVSGWYFNGTGEYLSIDIYYYDSDSEDLIHQDRFLLSVGEDEVISSIDIIDVDSDGIMDIIVGGWYWDTTEGKWFAFVAVFSYEYGGSNMAGSLTMTYWIAWANSNDRINSISASNMDGDDDIEISTVGSADTRGQVSVVTLDKFTEGTVSLNADNFIIGQTITATVVDADLNIDPEIAETVVVHVTSDTDTAGIDITLTETGSNTGVFTGTFTAVTTSSSQVNHQIQVNPDGISDTIYVSYTDEHYGTALDSLELTDYMLQTPEFAEFIFLGFLIILPLFIGILTKKKRK